ncbi:MAG: glycosyltransferase family 2 protein [Planctomycetota bacterium]|jgi:glycosyltransferase involved in cell wall biosynthesis
MKLIIQIPCYNEETTLPDVIRDLPRQIDGIDTIEYLIIDDGSSDRTVEVAKELGVHHIVIQGSNQGLAKAFTTGVRRCAELGADIIVNTDGDNQYKGQCIKDLVGPILEGRAEIVIGCRPIEEIEDFSWIKKRLQRIGSGVVRRFSGTDVPDTTSGFRAYSSDAAMMLHVFNRYTYTLETIIQAGAMDMRICDAAIEVNPKTRESRLISSIPRYIWRSMSVIFRSYITYKPFQTFFYMSLLPGVIGLFYCVRFFYFHFSGKGGGHIQSLILAGVLLMISFNLFTLGIIGYLIGTNRKLVQETLHYLRSRLRKAGR